MNNFKVDDLVIRSSGGSYLEVREGDILRVEKVIEDVNGMEPWLRLKGIEGVFCSKYFMIYKEDETAELLEQVNRGERAKLALWQSGVDVRCSPKIIKDFENNRTFTFHKYEINNPITLNLNGLEVNISRDTVKIQSLEFSKSSAKLALHSFLKSNSPRFYCGTRELYATKLGIRNRGCNRTLLWKDAEELHKILLNKKD